MQIASQIDYSKKPYLEPKYKHSQVYQQSGGQTQTLTASGGNESVFELPSKVFNLARSQLNFTLTPSAAGTAGTQYNWLFTDCVFPIRQIQLYTKSGIYLCDLLEVGNYTKIVSKAETKLDDFLTYPLVQGNDIVSNSWGRFSCRNNALVSSNTRTAASPFAQRFDGGGTTPAVSNASINYTEPKYLEPGAAVDSATPVLNVKLPLGHIKNTILALDKDVYFGDVLLLKIIWAGYNKSGFRATSVTNPALVPTALAFNIAVSNLILYLACEQNEAINQQLITQYKSSGLSMLIPYTYLFRYNPGELSSASITIRLSRANGIRLQKIYLSAFNSAESAATSYDCSNNTTADDVGTTKIQTFYTMLDNNRLQDININCANSEDYMMLESKLKGSVVQSADIYKYNWFWLEDFTGAENKLIDDYDNLEAGLNLDVERKYDFNMLSQRATPQAFNFYVYAVCQKLLTISPQGIIAL